MMIVEKFESVALEDFASPLNPTLEKSSPVRKTTSLITSSSMLLQHADVTL